MPKVVSLHYLGIAHQHANGKDKKFIVRQQIRYHDKIDIIPSIGLVTLEEDTHLFKTDDYALYISISHPEGTTHYFFHKDGCANQLISEREKEVLTLIAQGHSSKEVGEILFISPRTVSQHRKNMIKKVNARDTSSLIQICKICKII